MSRTSTLPRAGDKLVAQKDLQKLVRRLRRAGKKVVWTNGCFDVLHVGHVRYLDAARRLGDVLIVGVNSDGSTRKLKGPGRPVVPERHRAEIVASLSAVDYVVVFGARSPARLLGIVTPDIFVKGGDYNLETVDPVERATVEKHGGQLAFISFVRGQSTTRMLRRMRNSS